MDGRSEALQGVLPGLFHLGYPVNRTAHDEMAAPDGSVRPHWRPFLETLSVMPVERITSRWDRAQRLIRDHGVTYNVYADGQGDGAMHRPWELDPIPLILDGAEWAAIEAGLIQRATLLNIVLSDLYGSQKLFANGSLPPAIAYSHPGFLRPVHGIDPPQGRFVTAYAADLARSPDGKWWVLRDRTESPAGMGYALENRIILSRVLPELFRTNHVRRQAPFFQTLRDSLPGLAPRGRENPRIVLLTPGPYNETYFEHAYLARYLGYTLVENEDLTVREGRVYMKTLEGLLQVDVILRRTDSAFLDPLELRADSALGVPGLMQAVHQGQVALVNAPGSGLAETSAFRPFLPKLCETLLGEDLKMPTVATWWCGQETERDFVLENLDRLVVKCPTFQGRKPDMGPDMTPRERDALAQRIKADPHRFIGQEIMTPSTTPVWTDGRLEPRSMVMRVFLTWDGESYRALPGGLGRCSTDPRLTEFTLQHGGGSKDVWVSAAQPVVPFSLLKASGEPVKPVRGGRALPSRVADNMFWLGRHVERCEMTTRVLRAVLGRTVEGPGLAGTEELQASLRLLTGLGYQAPETAFDTPAEQDRAVRALMRANFDPKRSTGLRPSVDWLRRVSTTVRDRLSLDTWRAVNRLTREIGGITGDEEDLNESLVRLNEVVLTLQAISGLSMENMTRGLGWRFLETGRRLERAMQSLTLLRALLAAGTGETEDPDLMEVLLEIGDSVMTYRSRYLAGTNFAPVLDLLMADETNPRSLAFQIARLSEHMDAIEINRGPGAFAPAQRIMIAMLASVRTLDLEDMADRPPSDSRQTLSRLFNDLDRHLRRLSEVLTRQYFAHAAETPSAQARPGAAL